MNNVTCPGPSFEEKVKVNTTPVILGQPLTIVGSTPMDVSQAFRYTFFAIITSGNEVDVFVQTSPDLKNWFLDSVVISIDLPPLLVTDKAVLTGNNYSRYARLGFVQRKDPSEIAVIFQSQLLPCILPQSEKNPEIGNNATVSVPQQQCKQPLQELPKKPLNWRLKN